MNFDESFPKRVSMTRNSLGLTQAELAKKVGVVPRQIAAYEGGEANPREKALGNLAAALGTTPEWLATGRGIAPDIRLVKSTAVVPIMPVYTFKQLVEIPIHNIGIEFAAEYITSIDGTSVDSFGVIIDGESMQSSDGVGFPPGSIVIFDPYITPIDGDFILCKIQDENEVTFKKLIADQGVSYLKPLNEDYPDISFNNDLQIIGVATKSIINLDFHSREKLKAYSYSKNNANEKKDKQLVSINKRLDKIESMLEHLLNKQ
ncbi:helix-turn-helix domain-containing protein [Providencia rettgeri]|uniref:LexA family protein n=1 Tax=Providencia rettgeri TaxID=587 RepID=UPI00140437B7|nr:S24 family peptidase [Providencia rettgeri]NHN53841.1 helix-turn-helix domain-containing protein [Providencia rettgeri]